MQNQVYSYVKEEDRKRYLFGKLMLRKLLVEYGNSKTILNNIQIGENSRPYLIGNIDFNISHSGDYVICAISNESKIGIDIEKIIPINVMEIENLVLNDAESEKMKKMIRQLKVGIS